jgi:proprotein convertase subtilisin/kexin type 5
MGWCCVQVETQLFRAFYNLEPHDLLKIEVMLAMGSTGTVDVNVDGSTMRRIALTDLTNATDCTSNLKRGVATLVVPHHSAVARVRLSGSATFGVVTFRLSTNGSPLSCQCDENEYNDNGNCQPCADTCATCSGAQAMDCRSCFPGNFLQTETGTCAPCGTCDGATEYQSDACGPQNNVTCSLCDASCATCTGATNGDCIHCATGYDLDAASGLCLPECPVGERLEGNTCVGCGDPLCASCTSDGCTACMTAAFLHNGSCLSSCGSGFFEDPSGRCLPCADGCSDCDGPRSTECNACARGKLRLLDASNNFVCLEACPQGMYGDVAAGVCRACSGGCSKGTFQSAPCRATADRDCSGCDPACTECSVDGTVCTACSPLEYLANGTCVRCTTDCADGTFQSGKCTAATTPVCLPCAAGCARCSGVGAGDCQSCRAGFFRLSLEGGNSLCTAACPAGHFADARLGVCKECKTQCASTEFQASSCTDDSDLSCLACDPSCATCRDATSCSTCPSNHFIAPTKLCQPCRSTCPRGSFAVTQRCSLTEDLVCAACSSSCATCRNASACETCVVGFQTASNGLCISAAEASKGGSSKSSGVPVWVVAVVAVVGVLAVVAVLAFRKRSSDGGVPRTSFRTGDAVSVLACRAA